MKKIKTDESEHEAIILFNEWNDVTGFVDPSSGYRNQHNRHTMTYNEQSTYLENVRMTLKRMLSEDGDIHTDILCDEMARTMKSKGDDYAGSRDRLANFKEAGELTGITPAQQCLSLIAVKVARLGTLLNSGATPNNESILDSMKDLTIYTVLLQMIEQEPDNTPVKWWESVK